MKIKIKNLQPHLKEKAVLYYEKSGRDDLLKGVGGKFIDSIKVGLTAEKIGEQFELGGKIETTLQLTCSRCLDEIIYPIETEFYVTIGDKIHEDKSDGADDIIFINNGEVDILPHIEGIIFSELPLTPLCSTDCRGLCQMCGKNKNNSECNCQQDNIDPRWAKLKELNRGRR